MGKNQSNEKFKSKIGGQALIEGIMMLGPNKGAMACRLPDGSIDLETWEENNGKNAPWYKKTPLVRGCVNFIESMIRGYKYMMKSAEKQLTEEEKAEEEKSGIFDVVMYIGMFIGIIMAVGLFMFLPKWIVGLFSGIAEKRIIRSILEGIVKIAVFVAYMALVSLMKDIRRQYEYHGAEHKTIACHEAELPLTIENVRKQSRFHKRCGTSFIFIVLIISILVMCLVPFTVTWQRVVASLVLLPLIVGISYECIRLAGNHDNLFTRILSAPGLAMQRITTREPDDSMIEIAITALKECIPEDKSEDRW
ncbi:MAG: DUF1385 domain-containing protein [Prevotella sp.]|nr:DUF1385 domain-containing protein [Alistipes senegalensis]MCM1357756.1 DUF1385 domain-containing protein [Prevotella sp.]MCM1472552.1 DUF1385 domain-containing protein [Muribaculaceae bacterium]